MLAIVVVVLRVGGDDGDDDDEGTDGDGVGLYGAEEGKRQRTRCALPTRIDFGFSRPCVIFYRRPLSPRPPPTPSQLQNACRLGVSFGQLSLHWLSL
jgi:hypothetical protein